VFALCMLQRADGGFALDARYPHLLLPQPSTLNPTPYTLHPTPCTLHPTTYTLRRRGLHARREAAAPSSLGFRVLGFGV